jgi:hypothetical protein
MGVSGGPWLVVGGGGDFGGGWWWTGGDGCWERGQCLWLVVGGGDGWWERGLRSVNKHWGLVAVDS